MNERAVAHGGDLEDARRRFPDAPEPWIDLSSGINPIAYPLPPLASEVWTRLPQKSDLAGLERIAASAYGVAPGADAIAAPGTQALIQWLPRLSPAKRVGILETSYEEHAATWRASGAAVETVGELRSLAEFDVGVLVNPNNPNGRLIAPADLKPLAQHFAASGGLLVVDEAFMDVAPDQSFAPHLPERGIVILRSFGKIFGLAGLRLGFAIAGPELACMLRRALGPWAVSGPAIRIGAQALDDRHWVTRATERLSRDTARLDDLLGRAGFVIRGGTLLFRLASHAEAPGWFERLGRAGMLVRRFEERPDQLRFGLPGSDEAWQRLTTVLDSGRNQAGTKRCGRKSGERKLMASPYDTDLDRNPANHQPLTPLTYLSRAAHIFPDHPAIVHGDLKRTYSDFYTRCRQLGSALSKRGIGRGDTVSVMLANTPAMLECHYGVPMCKAVLNTLNTRLDAAILAFTLDHAETKVLIVDREFSPTIKEAVAKAKVKPLIIDYDDPVYDGPGDRAGEIEYEAFIAEGDPSFDWPMPDDEWDAISLNYTSGTTGDPKGVVYHHRGAHLLALANVVTGAMARHPVYLWTLPMFHCNGWCFPWSISVMAGTHVCLRQVRAGLMYDLMSKHRVTHLCGAPIVMSILLNASDAEKKPLPQRVEFFTAAAPPPEAVLAEMKANGFNVTHLYGLTETYGPAAVNEWHRDWDRLDPAEQAARKARQGVRYVTLENLDVKDPDTMESVPLDAETMGEVMFRGNVVMKGYLKNKASTDAAFAGGWFHSGDLGVKHPDGYIQLKDRSKDIIISGGENISSIEVEDALYKHPAVQAAAVVAKPDDKWGETPCAFIELKPNESASEEEIIAWCRDQLARYKVPRHVVFGDLPKTSTGKIQKFVLRERAKSA